ncbi:MAG: hypothetical protein R2778_05870 [Saprospiraceae bacterium]
MHEAGFKASPGERRWSITLNRTAIILKEKRVGGTPGHARLGAEIRSLNELQQQSGQEAFWLHEKQKQLYADWYVFAGRI